MREECDEDPSQSDETEAEMSPPKSPSTPKNVKSKNSGIVSDYSFITVQELVDLVEAVLCLSPPMQQSIIKTG